MRFSSLFLILFLCLSSQARDLRLVFKDKITVGGKDKKVIDGKKYDLGKVKGIFSSSPKLVGEDRLILTGDEALTLLVDDSQFLPKSSFVIETFFRFGGANGVLLNIGKGNTKSSIEGLRLTVSRDTLTFWGKIGGEARYFTKGMALTVGEWCHGVVRYDADKKTLQMFLNGKKINDGPVGEKGRDISYSRSRDLLILPKGSSPKNGEIYYLGLYSSDKTLAKMTDEGIVENSKKFQTLAQKWLVEDQQGKSGPFYNTEIVKEKVLPSWFSSLFNGVGLTLFLLWAVLWSGLSRRVGAKPVAYLLALTPFAPLYFAVSKWSIEDEIKSLKSAGRQRRTADGEEIEAPVVEKPSRKSRKTKTHSVRTKRATSRPRKTH